MLIRCKACAKEVLVEDKSCPHCGSELPTYDEDEELSDIEKEAKEAISSNEIYREPTMNLRFTIFLIYYLIFMSLAAAGVFFIAVFPSIIFTGPIIWVEFWIARNLGKYSNLARYLTIGLAVIIIVINIAVIIISAQNLQYLGGFFIVFGTYLLYAMTLHKSTAELFSGKYQPDPDYTLFG